MSRLHRIVLATALSCARVLPAYAGQHEAPQFRTDGTSGGPDLLGDTMPGAAGTPSNWRQMNTSTGAVTALPGFVTGVPADPMTVTPYSFTQNVLDKFKRLEVSLEDFGGKADAVPQTALKGDGTAATDNLVAYNALIGAITSFGNGLLPGYGVTVRLHGGSGQSAGRCYYFSGSVDFGTRHGFVFQGSDNPFQSCATVAAGTNFPLFKNTGTSYGAPVVKQGVKNLTLYGPGPIGGNPTSGWASLARGIDSRYVNDGDYSDNYFLGWNQALYLVGEYETKVDRNNFPGGSTAGVQTNNYCVYMDVPQINEPSQIPNNSIRAHNNLCQYPYTEGLRALDFSGSLFELNQWLAGAHGVHICDLPPSAVSAGKYAVGGQPANCEFGTWQGDQVDTTTSQGWVLAQGSAAVFHDIAIKGATWTGNTFGAGFYIGGLNDSDIDFGEVVTTDIGVQIVNSARNRFVGHIVGYNRQSNGALPVALSGSDGQGNTIHISTSTTSGTGGTSIDITPLGTPASSSAACATGQTMDDTGYHYVCTAPNTWKRAALSGF